jgi:hypothetical protein
LASPVGFQRRENLEEGVHRPDEGRRSGPHRGRRTVVRWSTGQLDGIPAVTSGAWWMATTLVSSLGTGRERVGGEEPAKLKRNGKAALGDGPH